MRRRKHSLKNRSRNRAWKALSKKIRAACGKCEICGDTDNLVVHHILDKKTHPALWLDEMNLCCVCRSCHWKIHRGFSWEFVAWLKKNSPQQWQYIMDIAQMGDI